MAPAVIEQLPVLSVGGSEGRERRIFGALALIDASAPSDQKDALTSPFACR